MRIKKCIFHFYALTSVRRLIYSTHFSRNRWNEYVNQKLKYRNTPKEIQQCLLLRMARAREALFQNPDRLSPIRQIAAHQTLFGLFNTRVVSQSVYSSLPVDRSTPIILATQFFNSQHHGSHSNCSGRYVDASIAYHAPLIVDPQTKGRFIIVIVIILSFCHGLV